MLGVLLNNQWSVGGNPLTPAVNAFLAQPFANYNMAHGWYLTTSPIITSNWLAASGQQWTVPIGGGVGRVFKVGDQPVNAQVAAYYNAVRPTGTSDWQLRAVASVPVSSEIVDRVGNLNYFCSIAFAPYGAKCSRFSAVRKGRRWPIVMIFECLLFGRARAKRKSYAITRPDRSLSLSRRK